MASIRERLERQEAAILSASACLSRNAVRDRQEEPCPIRTAYMRDRDRILHSKAFRRLKHKTQVFLSPEGDHYRTRLTHTLEVAQIARTISSALALNCDLTEAIALGHDLGHTPFGHAGEAALERCCPHGFRHAVQSVRVLELLEKQGEGLNLTVKVRNGILFHSTGPKADSLEGRAVYYADKIAYLNHDVEDAIRAGVLSEQELPWRVKYVAGRTKSQRIFSFVDALIRASGSDIKMAGDMKPAFDELREFMFENIYNHPIAKAEEKKAIFMLEMLYRNFKKHPQNLPDEYLKIAHEQDVDSAVRDYISGMSDRYAVSVFEGMFIPRSWGV
jgi:dGTPase